MLRALAYDSSALPDPQKARQEGGCTGVVESHSSRLRIAGQETQEGPTGAVNQLSMELRSGKTICNETNELDQKNFFSCPRDGAVAKKLHAFPSSSTGSPTDIPEFLRIARVRPGIDHN